MNKVRLGKKEREIIDFLLKNGVMYGKAIFSRDLLGPIDIRRYWSKEFIDYNRKD